MPWTSRLPVAGALGLLLGAGACGYESSYVAPADGRPRVVWGAKNQPTVELSGVFPSADCAAELRRLTGQSELVTTTGPVDLPESSAPAASYVISGGFWTPRYYGPPIVIVTPGVVPFFPRPPIFSPSLLLASAIVSSRSHGKSFGGGSSFGGGGLGKDAGKGLLILAVLAVAVLPAIDIGLAAAHPESAGKSSAAIDLANAYNDLLRTPGSPCSAFAAADFGQQPGYLGTPEAAGLAPPPPLPAPPALPAPGAVP